MCEWKSVEICALAEKFRWHQKDLKSFHQRPNETMENSEVGKEAFHEDI